MTNCKNCGAPVDSSAHSCSYCGTPYEDEFYELKITDPNDDYSVQLAMYNYGLITPNELRKLINMKGVIFNV